MHQQIQVRLQSRRVELVEEQPHRLVLVPSGLFHTRAHEGHKLLPGDSVVHGFDTQFGDARQQDLHDELHQVGLSTARLAHDDNGQPVAGLLEDQQDLGEVVNVELVALPVVELTHAPEDLLLFFVDVPVLILGQPGFICKGLDHSE